MDIWQGFNETKLPSQESFYSKLDEEDISNKIMTELSRYGTDVQ